LIPLDDALVEGTEGVELRLTTSSHYVIGHASQRRRRHCGQRRAQQHQPRAHLVTIVATDPSATEIEVVPPGQGRPQLYDPAVFTVTRTGATGEALTVFYSLGGSASNGADYASLPGSLTIPAGASSPGSRSRPSMISPRSRRRA
jgi:hypothetical protein